MSSDGLYNLFPIFCFYVVLKSVFSKNSGCRISIVPNLHDETNITDHSHFIKMMRSTFKRRKTWIEKLHSLVNNERRKKVVNTHTLQEFFDKAILTKMDR